MKKVLSLAIVILFSQFAFAQISSDFEKLALDAMEYGLYTPGRTYEFKTTMSNKYGEQISAEKITLEIPASLNKDIHTDSIHFVWHYHYTQQDSIDLHQSSKTTTEKCWVKKDTTTLRLNKEELYVHPIRENQYHPVEISPHPHLKFKVLEDGKYESTIMVIKNYGQYNGKPVVSTYVPKGKLFFDYQAKKIPCYQIDAIAEVQGMGTNSCSFLFSPEFGFVKHAYSFYNGHMLAIELVNHGFDESSQIQNEIDTFLNEVTSLQLGTRRSKQINIHSPFTKIFHYLKKR